MKEAIVAAGPKVSITDSPIPTPNDDQLVIKVVVSGSNPKDWKVPEWTGKTENSGDDIAGIVHEVGKNVSEFKPGDRVFAFHEMVSLASAHKRKIQFTSFAHSGWASVDMQNNR